MRHCCDAQRATRDIHGLLAVGTLSGLGSDDDRVHTAGVDRTPALDHLARGRPVVILPACNFAVYKAGTLSWTDPLMQRRHEATATRQLQRAEPPESDYYY